MSDPLWKDYGESVHSLVRLPDLHDDRRRQATEEEEASAHRARSALDAALNRCEQWRTQGKRAIANTEARLVAARVLVPDPSGAPTISYDSPEPLVEDLTALIRQLDGDLVVLEEARRRARLAEQDRAASAKRLAEQRAKLIKYGSIAGAVLLVLLALALALR